MRIHLLPACWIISNKGERTLFYCVSLSVGHETWDQYLLFSTYKHWGVTSFGTGLPVLYVIYPFSGPNLTGSFNKNGFNSSFDLEKEQTTGLQTRNFHYYCFYTLSYIIHTFFRFCKFLSLKRKHMSKWCISKDWNKQTWRKRMKMYKNNNNESFEFQFSISISIFEFEFDGRAVFHLFCTWAMVNLPTLN